MYNPETRDFERRLARLSELSRIVESTLAERADHLDASVSATAATLGEEARDDYIEWHAEDFFILGDELPTLMRYSILVGAEAALESYLGKTCDSFAIQSGAILRHTDLRSSGVDRMREYLKKVGGMPFPDGGEEWVTMKNLRKIRNAFVHADGVVVSDRAAIERWSEDFDGLRISDRGTVTLTETFAERVISSYTTFGTSFDRACQAMQLVPEFPVEDA